MTRISDDAYYTPLPIYTWLASKLNLKDKRIFDPCCGTEHPTLKAFQAKNLVIENDIGRDIMAHYHSDATCDGIWLDSPNNNSLQDWVITNPPYTRGVCEKIVENSLLYSSEGVAMLLRLSWLEPTKSRHQMLNPVLSKTLYNKQLVAVYPVNPRPRFDPFKNGSDSCTVAWFIWCGNDSIKLEPFDFCTGWNKNN
jgi:hypothetical protein